MKKKCISLLLAAVLSIGALTGCQSAATENEAKTEQTQEAKNQETKVPTLTVLMYTDWYKAGWQALEAYVHENAETLGFDLEISKIQGGQQGDQVLQTKFATNDLPDILQVYKPQWVESYANGLDQLVDLSGIKSVEQYDEAALKGTFIYKDKLYAMPIDSIVLSGVFYNKDVFEANNIEIPQTWDELLQACETLKAAGIVPVYYSGKDAWSVQPPTIGGMVSEAAARGEDTFALMDQINTHQVTFSECKEFVDVIERTKQLIDLGYVNETYLSDTVDNAHQALADGTCAMYINGTWCADNIEQKFPEKADRIGAFAMPTPTGENYINMFTPFSLTLTTSCSDVELGKQAIDFLSSATAQQIYADAQPGLYLNQEINCTIPAATADLQAIMQAGKSMTDWEEIVSYSYGTLAEQLLNYYTGTFTDASEVTQALDDETARNAKAKGDTNW